MNALPAIPEGMLAVVRAAERVWLGMPQEPVKTEHVLHAGMYSRTVRLAADILMTGVLVKIPTLLVLQGNCLVLLSSGWARFDGFNVIRGSAGRKQVYATIGETTITMLFATSATSVEEAEREFTDETYLLASRKPENMQTSEGLCLA